MKEETPAPVVEEQEAKRERRLKSFLVFRLLLQIDMKERRLLLPSPEFAPPRPEKEVHLSSITCNRCCPSSEKRRTLVSIRRKRKEKDVLISEVPDLLRAIVVLGEIRVVGQGAAPCCDRRYISSEKEDR
ncbi:hypothetical protein AAC387_Pa05g3015 [Persea americana]